MPTHYLIIGYRCPRIVCLGLKCCSEFWECSSWEQSTDCNPRGNSWMIWAMHFYGCHLDMIFNWERGMWATVIVELGIRTTCLCNLIASSGINAQSQMYYFHLLIHCCWVHLTLWPDRSDRTYLILVLATWLLDSHGHTLFQGVEAYKELLERYIILYRRWCDCSKTLSLCCNSTVGEFHKLHIVFSQHKFLQHHWMCYRWGLFKI